MAMHFEGIAAPERDEPGGTEATPAIEALVLGKRGSLRADREANV